MPSVSTEGKELQRVSNLAYLGVLFYQNLCRSDHICQTNVKSKTGLVALKTMATDRMSQRILVIIFQELIKQSVVWAVDLLSITAKTTRSHSE